MREDPETDFICGMKERGNSKVTPGLWMAEEGTSKGFDEISSEGRKPESRRLA